MHKDGAENSEWQHSLMMSKLFMDKLFLWSMQECLLMKVESLPNHLNSLKLIVEHLHFRTFATMGWNVWSRYVPSVCTTPQNQEADS
jgi:hypothetical protein